MNKELIRNIGQRTWEKFWNLPLWVTLPTACAFCVGHEIYAAVWGRFDRQTRESAIQFKMEQAFLRGDSGFSLSLLWSRENRRDARTQISDALRWKQDRDAWFDAMSDEESRRYVEGSIQGFREAVRPIVELNRRKN